MPLINEVFEHEIRNDYNSTLEGKRLKTFDELELISPVQRALADESYVHRIGRTGRAGAAGIALTFCMADQRRELRAIERLIGRKLLITNEQEQSPSETRQPKRRTPSRRRATTADSAIAFGGRQNRKRKRSNRNSRINTQRVKQTN